MTQNRVRAFRRGDLDAVLAIESEANPVPWRAADFLPFLQDDAPPGAPSAGERRMAWVHAGPDGGGVAGFACAAAFADEAELQSIAVAAGHRGRGMGSALLEAFRVWARQAGARSAHLEVREGNAAAIALYRRQGFTETGRRPRYYQDNGETAVLMSLELAPPVP